MTRSPGAGPLTHGDLDDLPEDGNRYEIIDGELHVTAQPTTAHQWTVTKVVSILDQHVTAEGVGMVFSSGLKVVLDVPTGVVPDVVYIAKGVDALRHDGYYGPPDLAVEVLSSKPTLDTIVKRRKYARSGIRYYWMIDADAHTLWELRLEGPEYIVQAELHGDADFRPELFPRLVIPLARLWLPPLAR